MDAANLRRDPIDTTVWRRAGKPQQVYRVGVLPFYRTEPYGDGRSLLLLIDNGNRLYWKTDGMVSEASTTEPQLLGELQGEPILANDSTKGVVRLKLKGARDVYLTYDEDLTPTFRGEMPELPKVELTAADSSTLYASLGDIALTGGSAGTSGSRLSEGDASRVKAAMLSAYRSVQQQANHLGRWLQPIAARCRMLDASGNTVWLGEKQSLGCSGGGIPTSEVVMQSTDGMATLTGGTLAARTYLPQLIVPQQLPYPWSKIVDRLVVEVTQELNPISTVAPLPNGIQQNSQTGTTTVTVQLPGLATEKAINQLTYNQLTTALLDSQFYKTYLFYNPLSGGITYNGTILEEGEKLPLGKVDPTIYEKSERESEFSDPRERCYTAALEAGEFTILCNPRNLAENGSSEAGVVDIVRSADMGEIVARSKLTNCEIHTVKLLPRSGSGWDFSRQKLLVFSREGILLVTLNARGEVHASTPIDHRRVDWHSCVAEATGGNGARILTFAGGDLVEISGQKVVTLLSLRSLPFYHESTNQLQRISGIGWSGEYKEIWMTNGEQLWRVSERGEIIRALLPGIEGVDYQPPLRLGRFEGELYLATSRETLNLCREDSQGLLDTVLRRRFRNPAGSHAGYSQLNIELYGTGLLGGYTLRGDRGTERPEKLLHLVYTGDVNEATRLTAALPRRAWLEEEFRFAAQADFYLGDTSFDFGNQLHIYRK